MPRLEHIGIAVDDPQRVAELFETLLGELPYKRERVDREGVQTHFISAESAKLELLEALDPDSPVARYLDKRGEGLHHLAFEVDDVEAHMQALRSHGFTPLSEVPRPGADGKRIFFLHPKETHGVLIEFCQSVPSPLPATPVPYRGGHLAAYPCGDPGRPTLVVLHGAAGTTLLETEPLVRRLEQNYHVLALDFGGHGGSDVFPEIQLTPDFFADNVRALLDYFEVPQAHLFGFSMGGSMALHFAKTYPHRAARLAVHGANLDWNDALVAAMMARLDAVASSHTLANRFEQAHRDWRALFERTAQFTRALVGYDFPGALDSLSHPVLVSAVDRDELFPLDLTLRLYRALPHGTLAVLPGNRHTLTALNSELLADLLRQHFGA